MDAQQTGRHLASQHPLQDLDLVSYSGQDPKRRMYRNGYEDFMNEMPILDSDDPFLHEKLNYSKGLFENLAVKLTSEPWLVQDMPREGHFARTILAIEQPLFKGNELEAGIEIIVAKWGKGFTSPVHGHKAGFMYEQLLTGKMLVNLYRMKDPTSGFVRPIRSDIYSNNSNLLFAFTEANPTQHFPRQSKIHNFAALEESTSLHFVPEHTRDGRDNAFKVEYFDDVFNLTKDDVQRLDATQGIYQLRAGDVALVRSSGVPEYGYHYIVVTDYPILKLNGMRPQDVAICIPKSNLLDTFDPNDNLVLLKLKSDAKETFMNFHGITVKGKEVIFPQA